MKITSILLSCSVALGTAVLISGQQSSETVQLPVITVVADKQPASVQDVPMSVTAVTGKTLSNDSITTVKDASVFAPNVFVNEFGARKLSNPYFRGIGSSPNNPGITTYIDGVPQLNANSSSIELLDVDQIEFVRGSQAELYGRNTIGGLINITSRQPSLAAWGTVAEGNYGNYSFGEASLSVSGPIIPNELGLGLAGGYTARDGYTRNDLTGHLLDTRDDFLGKVQLLWRPDGDWEVRLLLTGERDRDGDYALGDLKLIRANPHHVSHDFEGYTHRDIVAPTLWIGHKGAAVDFTMITGLVHWRTDDMTDLDYTADPVMSSTRKNAEQELQFTEEVRLASSKDAPLELTDDLKLKWQTGLFAFTQDYKQDAYNDLSSSFAGLGPGFRLAQQQNADLQDVGAGIYGQTTLTAWDKLDFTLGLRCDWERKDADLETTNTVFLPPPFGGAFPSTVSVGRDYTDVLPSFGVEHHLTPDHKIYATVARGYKAGGFSAAAPPGSESYGEERTWDYELGCKTAWLNNRLQVNFAVFYIDWRNIQTNQPNPFSPGQFYIANAGAAASKGVELELIARPVSNWDIFGGIGYTDARFQSGSTDTRFVNGLAVGSVNISGNKLQYAPVFTANAGLQYSLALCKEATAYARAEVIGCGNYDYNNQNTASQGAYALTNFRLGVRGARWFAEGWIKNAFDINYVPVAFTYNSASGMIGESDAPMTCGVRVGLNF